jgi:hypothetical protein
MSLFGSPLSFPVRLDLKGLLFDNIAIAVRIIATFREANHFLLPVSI